MATSTLAMGPGTAWTGNKYNNDKHVRMFVYTHILLAGASCPLQLRRSEQSNIHWMPGSLAVIPTVHALQSHRSTSGDLQSTTLTYIHLPYVLLLLVMKLPELKLCCRCTSTLAGCIDLHYKNKVQGMFKPYGYSLYAHSPSWRVLKQLGVLNGPVPFMLVAAICKQ